MSLFEANYTIDCQVHCESRHAAQKAGKLAPFKNDTKHIQLIFYAENA